MTANTTHRIALIYLAAGASRRMGRDKALLPWHGRTVVAHHLETLALLQGVDPWIVTRPEDDALTRELDQIGWPPKYRVVNPQAPDCEMMESIIVGARGALEYPYSAIAIALIDQARINPSTLAALADGHAERPDHILQPVYGGRRGHPVLLPCGIAKQLTQAGAPTFKHFLAEQESARGAIEVNDPGVVTDMDTPEAYRAQLLST